MLTIDRDILRVGSRGLVKFARRAGLLRNISATQLQQTLQSKDPAFEANNSDPLNGDALTNGHGSQDGQSRRSMRILILSWRCPHNPRAGGAEAFTYEVAKRLVAQGHSVEWFASSYPGARPTEDLDGIQVVRAGSWWSVYWHGFRRYSRSMRGAFDVVIDEVNVIPFFAHAWSGLPTYALIFQLHRAVWFYQTSAVLAALGFVAEPLYMRACRRTPILTISASTEQDLRRLGYTARITIVPVGVDQPPVPDLTKAKSPAFIYVGRLVPAKRIEHVFRAFANYRRLTGGGLLWLVGTGPEAYQHSLRKLARRLQLDGSVRFWGHVAPEEKHRLMAEARALLMTSVREGWGLVVSEANACGTPAIVYDVPGLRDAVRHETTGLVVRPRPKSLADAMIRLSDDSDLYKSLALEAQRWSSTFSWDETAKVVGQTLEEGLVKDLDPSVPFAQ